MIKILELHHDMPQIQKPIIIWIPSHKGIPGNTYADNLALEATKINQTTSCPLSTKEQYNHIRTKINRAIQREWDNTTTHLKNIHPKFELWQTTNQNTRPKERIICRLRIGHTRLTHSYLFNKADPPMCDHCNLPLNVSHILLTCRKFDSERQALVDFCQEHQIILTLPNILSDEHPDLHELLFEYLHNCGLFYEL